MTVAETTKVPPVAFISYSHDSRQHKWWVAELGRNLRRKGVDVILDQWDADAGDDLAKFMERSVSSADRVLIICTETYVQKADEGKGGVGYEAMIVTGELVQDLGVKKFIPIIRQEPGKDRKPKFLSTRKHIDFSRDDEFDEKFDELVRTLHKAPKDPKPELGPNPFAEQDTSIRETVGEINPSPPLREGGHISDPSLSAYRSALDIATSGDRIRWRKLVQKAITVFPGKLNSWRANPDPPFPTSGQDLPKWAAGGLATVPDLFAIALAGVESGQDYFNNQIGVIEEILNPAGWERSGLVTLVHYPEFLGFVYQALIGGVALQTTQAHLAERLARIPIENLYDGESYPLMESTNIIGWPDSLNHTVTIAWKFLMDLPEIWPWLLEVFGTVEFYRAAVCAYYELLNIIEFLDAVNRDMDLSQLERIRLYVPVCFAVVPEAIQRRSARILDENRPFVRDLWVKTGSTLKKQQQWSDWQKLMLRWITEVYRGRAFAKIPHDRFVLGLQA